MNPIFWILVSLVGFLIWVALSVIFIPIGKLLYYKWKNLDEKINSEFEEKQKEEEKVEE